VNQILQENKENGVTIVIPVFNRENILGLTLESVVKQTYTNYRCIIVDDGSTDSTVSVARKFQNADERISVIENPQNSGACYCRNLGLSMARSEYIVFLDSDDIWCPCFLEMMLGSLEAANGFDAAACQALVYEDEIGDMSGTRFAGVSAPINFERYIREEVAWITSCMLWKTKAIRAVGGFAEHLTMWQDWDLNVRFLGSGGEILPVINNLVYSKVSKHNQITNQVLGINKLKAKYFSRQNSWGYISAKIHSEKIRNWFLYDFINFSISFISCFQFALAKRSLFSAFKIRHPHITARIIIREYLKKIKCIK
jgi:glycosyltransferase involved in cell wall biosynthesis